MVEEQEWTFKHSHGSKSERNGSRPIGWRHYWPKRHLSSGCSTQQKRPKDHSFQVIDSSHTIFLSSYLIMFRTAVMRASRAAAIASPRIAQSAIRRATPAPFLANKTFTPFTRISAVRCYSAAAGLNEEEVTGRILDLLKNFDKVSRIEVKIGTGC